tara:strand:- start:300 stop:878 length:579 start_codon:yes stop_codon:yes gene_type:complete
MSKDKAIKKNKKTKNPVFIGLNKDGTPHSFPFATPQESSIHNTGLFAATDIPKDEFVIQYLGEKITKNESTRRGLDQHDKSLCEDVGSVYIFELDEEYDLDGNFDWNISRLANHSCSPNCEAQNADGEIWFVTLRDIKEDEELTFDYGYALEHWEDHPCLCGSDNCAGYIVRAEDREGLMEILKKKEKELTK